MSATEENAKENDLVLAVIIPDGEFFLQKEANKMVSYAFYGYFSLKKEANKCFLYFPLSFSSLISAQHSLPPNNLQEPPLEVRSTCLWRIVSSK